jgi:hypothetical protein
MCKCKSQGNLSSLIHRTITTLAPLMEVDRLKRQEWLMRWSTNDRYGGEVENMDVSIVLGAILGKHNRIEG